MDFDWSPEEESFRQEVREFLSKELTDEVRGSIFIDTPARVDFVRKMAERGWLGMGFPEKYGGSPRPIPRDWLPDPQPAEDTREWSDSLERIMSAADPELRRLASLRAAPHIGSWSTLGLWWKPVAVFAAAATTFLILSGRPGKVAEQTQASLPLSLIAAQGDPVTIWETLGIEAHPVLALIVFREQEASSRSGAPPGTPEEANR